jgi:hypothetical protein
MWRTAFVLSLALSLTACGVPSSAGKQAEHLASIASEGAILARDAAEGDTTSTFARGHAQALRKKAEALAEAASGPRLHRVAAAVVTQLERLESCPDDREAAARVVRNLRAAATRAEEIGKSGS